MREKSSSVLFSFALALTLGCGSVSSIDAEDTSKVSRDLSLAAYLHEVIRTNPTVEEGWLKWLIKSRQARAAWGAFEPTLSGSYQENGLEKQNTALEQYQQLGTSTYDELNKIYSVGLQGILPIGTAYTVGATVTRLQNTYVELGQFESFVGITAQQPLLKGATHGAALAPVRTSFVDRKVAFHDYRKQLTTMIARAETAYWNLAFAQRANQMAADSVKNARYLLDVATQGARLGRMSDLDVQQAQAELASRMAEQNDRELSVTDAQTQLRLLMRAEDREGAQGIRYLASDPLVDRPLNEGELDEERNRLLEWAFRAQPDYVIAREELERQHILLGYQKDQVLPQLNITGSYGYSGLGSTIQDSIDSVESQDYPRWSVGLEMKIPLALGIKQRNDLKAEELKTKLAEVHLSGLRDEIRRSIESLVDSTATLKARIENARTVSRVKGQLLDLEMARLKNGTASLVEVYNAQDTLNQARLQELQVVVRYRQAMMQLEIVSGTVLKNQSLETFQDNQVTLSESLRSKYHLWGSLDQAGKAGGTD